MVLYRDNHISENGDFYEILTWVWEFLIWNSKGLGLDLLKSDYWKKSKKSVVRNIKYLIWKEMSLCSTKIYLCGRHMSNKLIKLM